MARRGKKVDIHLYLPDDIARVVAELARVEHRSLTNMAELLIREAVERRQADRAERRPEP